MVSASILTLTLHTLDTHRSTMALRVAFVIYGPAHIDSVHVKTGQQNLTQAVRLVNRKLSSWTLRLEAFAKSPNEEDTFE
jgi:hypothetical protein